MKTELKELYLSDPVLYHKKYHHDWYIANKEKTKERTAKTKKASKEWFNKTKGKLKCRECGESHIACLDFHHRDASKKTINPSKMASYGWSIKRMEEELSLCDVLCANCHRKLHYAALA